jgi:hypothetical protein
LFYFLQVLSRIPPVFRGPSGLSPTGSTPEPPLEHVAALFRTFPTASRECNIVVEEPVEAAKTSVASAAS